ncbi:hypothetical protein ACWEVD_15620 [Nocardia thailandica]
MNRNDIRPAAIGVTAGALTVAALIAVLEYDPRRAVAERLAQAKLSPEDQTELARIKQQRKDAYRAHRADQKRQDAERAEADARELAGFDPQLLSTPGMAMTTADLTVAQLATEIVGTKDRLSHGDLMYSAAVTLRRHEAALRCEWRRRDSFDARTKLPLVDQMRHRIAAEKVNTALYGPLPQLSYVD